MSEAISRRTFLRLSATAAGFATLLGIFGCGRADTEPIPLDSLTWRNKPLDNVNDGVLNTQFEFGSITTNSGLESKYRVLTYNNEDTIIHQGGLGMNPIDIFLPEARTNEMVNEQQMVAEFLHKKVDKIIILQEKVMLPDGNSSWVSLKTPGSRLHMEVTSTLTKNVDSQLDNDKLNLTARALKNIDPAGMQGDSYELAKVAAKGALIRAITDPKTPSEEANQIIHDTLYPNTLTLDTTLPDNWQQWADLSTTLRGMFSDIPEGAPMGLLFDIYNAVNSPFDVENAVVVDRQSYTDRDIASAIITNAAATELGANEIASCIIVPKNPDSDKALKTKEAFTALEEEFANIPKKPRVFKTTFKDGRTMIDIIHDFEHVSTNNERVTMDSRYNYEELISNKVLKDGTSATWQKIDNMQEMAQRVNNLYLSPPDIATIEEFPQDCIEWFVVPNKFVGEKKKRLVPGITFSGYKFTENEKSFDNTRENQVLFIGEYLRDKFSNYQPLDQTGDWEISQNWENWITNVTEKVNNSLELGVTQLYLEGMLTPKDFLSRLMRGYSAGDDFIPGEFKFRLPDDPYLRDVFATTSMDYLTRTNQKDQFEDVNLLVTTGEMNLQEIEYQDTYLGYRVEVENVLKAMGINVDEASSYQKLLALSKTFAGVEVIPDEFAPRPLEVGNRQIKLYPGDIVPIERVLKIRGEKYAVLKDVTSKESSTPMRHLMVIPLKEAMMNSLSLDPDSNIKEFVKDVYEMFIVPAYLVALVVAPEAVIGYSTAAFMAVRSRLGTLLASLGSKLVTAFL